jgi:hypothetical protein
MTGIVMKHPEKKFLPFRNGHIVLFCLCFFSLAAFSREEGGEISAAEISNMAEISGEPGISPEPELFREERPPRRRYFLPAMGLNLFSNVSLTVFNRFIMKNSFSIMNYEDLKEHFRGEDWEFENDYFATNFFGHPYHGSTYHTSAVANGYTFYEALLFDVFGSACWELFAESTPASINDLVFSSTGGAALGEMFHRLYLEVNSPFMALASPMDALNGLVTGRKPERRLWNLRNFSVSTGTGWANSGFYGTNAMELKFRSSPIYHVEASLVYGDPFRTQSWEPYEQFEFLIGGGIGKDWYDMRIISDGYLFSFSVMDTGVSQLTTGLTFNYDFFTSLSIDFYSEGIDWALKYRRVFSRSSLEFKAHAGWTGLGASNFYTYDRIKGETAVSRDYGTGANVKLFFSLIHPRAGKISLELLSYGMYIVSRRLPGMDGWDFCNYFTFSYVFPLPNNFFIGLSNTVSVKNSRYTTSVPGIDKVANSFRVYAGWSYYGVRQRGILR